LSTFRNYGLKHVKTTNLPGRINTRNFADADDVIPLDGGGVGGIEKKLGNLCLPKERSAMPYSNESVTES